VPSPSRFWVSSSPCQPVSPTFSPCDSPLFITFLSTWDFFSLLALCFQTNLFLICALFSTFFGLESTPRSGHCFPQCLLFPHPPLAVLPRSPSLLSFSLRSPSASLSALVLHPPLVGPPPFFLRLISPFLLFFFVGSFWGFLSPCASHAPVPPFSTLCWQDIFYICYFLTSAPSLAHPWSPPPLLTRPGRHILPFSICFFPSSFPMTLFLWIFPSH